MLKTLSLFLIAALSAPVFAEPVECQPSNELQIYLIKNFSKCDVRSREAIQKFLLAQIVYTIYDFAHDLENPATSPGKQALDLARLTATRQALDHLAELERQ